MGTNKRARKGVYETMRHVPAQGNPPPTVNIARIYASVRAAEQVFTEITLKNAGDVTLSEYGYKQENEIRQTTVKILVDTGAGTLVITEALQQELGLKTRSVQPVRMANSDSVNVQEADPVEVHWNNRSMVCRSWVIPGAQRALLGLIPLESMNLIVDPKEQTLIDGHGYEAVGILY